MKIDLTVHIADYINRYKSIALPGIGTFSKHHSSAAIEDNGQTIKPPVTAISFDSTLVQDDGFAHFVASREGIALNQSKRLLTLFSEKKLHDLLELGKARIYPLGHLYLAEEETTFLPEDNKLINKYFGMQPLTVEPIPYSETVKAESAAFHHRSSASITAANSEPQAITPWWRWLLIFLLAAIVVLTYLKCDELKARLGFDESSTSAIDTSAYVTMPSQDQAEVQEQDEIGNSSSEVTEHGQVNSPEADARPTESSYLHIDEINDGVIDSVLADEELRFAPGTERVDCVIILGSFKKQRNAIEMMAKVENAGYDLYIGVTGDYTRVGLTYNCAKEDLVSYLQSIRKQMVQEAWYLVPELHVEY